MTSVSKMMKSKSFLHTVKSLKRNETWTRLQSNVATACPAAGKVKDVANQCNPIRSYDEIPGPKAYPIVGNLFRFLPYIGEYGGKQMVEQMQMFHSQFGEIVKLEGIFSRRPVVFLFNAELAEIMYRHEGTWPLRVAMDTLKHYRESRPKFFNGKFCRGLTASQGQEWHEFRTNVNQSLMQPRAIKPHIQQADQVAGEFIEIMRQLRDTKTLKLPPTFNNEINKWSLESICAIALDHRMGCLTLDLPKDSQAQKMIDAVHVMFDLLYRLEVLPSMWRHYPTRNLKKLFKAMDDITSIALNQIQEAKKRFEKTGKSLGETSVLQKLFEINEETAKYMVLDMLTAGIDTTGNTSGSLLYYISANPRVQEKLREEVMRVLPEKDSPVTYKILNDIPYLKACIKESLRISPIAMGNLRTMTKDVELGGYLIPKGTDVVAAHAEMSSNSKHFEKPREFIPERWLRGCTEVTSAKNAHPFAYLPFGFGPRTCIGRRFAELEIEALTLKVIRNFQLVWTGPPVVWSTRFINEVATPLQFTLIDT